MSRNRAVTRFHRLTRFTAVLTLGGASVVAAEPTAEPTTAELLEQIKQLQAKVEQLEARKARESAEVAQTIQQLVADAEKRSSLFMLQTTEPGVTDLAGHEKGKFFIRSADGAFTLNPFLQFQFRNVSTYADALIDDGVDTGSEFENGFEMRRMKFGAEGTVFDQFDYKFIWAYNRSTGDVFLEDAIVTYGLDDRWSIFGGQYKDPVHHEELVSSTRQLAAERSLVNELIGGGTTDRVQGVALVYENDPLRVTGTVHDGQGSINTNFRDTPINDSDYGVAGRVEYKFEGEWKPYQDFTAMGNKKGLLVVGAGADYTGFEGESGIAYTADAQWENTEGLGIYGAFLGYYADAYGGGGSTSDYGLLGQVAQMVGQKTEVFGRVGWVDLDAGDDVWELTIGGNYYLHGHNAKFTADVTYLPNGSPGDSGSGIIDSGDEAQIVGRLQFQLVL